MKHISKSIDVGITIFTTLSMTMAYLFLGLALLHLVPCNADNSQKIEAESAFLTGLTIDHVRPGYSGSGYVTGFDEKGDQLTLTVKVRDAGIYNLRVGFAAPKGSKFNFIIVNNENLGSRYFQENEKFSEVDLGNIILDSGNNIIKVIPEWGFIDVDYFLISFNSLVVTNTPSQYLVTPDPSPEAKRLISYLVEMAGKKILSGQQGNDREFAYIKKHTGKCPAIRGFDLLSYSPSEVWKDNTTVAVIDWFQKQNGIPTICWHWFSPEGKVGPKSFYASDTDFDLETSLKKGSPQYELLIRDMDAIANELKIIRDANVPVLWRPLHEAFAGSFWWGAKGAESYIKLYRLMFDRLVRYHRINNLIWVWTTNPDHQAQLWYPGDDVVDILSTDIYLPAQDYSTGFTTFENLASIHQGKKLVALSENGPIPDPGRLAQTNTDWSWFCTWSGKYVLDGDVNTIDHLKMVYNDQYVITLDELPEMRSKIDKPSNELGWVGEYTIYTAFALLAIIMIRWRYQIKRSNKDHH